METFLPMVARNYPIQQEAAPEPSSNAETVTARISHYWPPLGGVNCFSFVNGECISRMASGKRWQKYIGVALACPRQYEFGTVFILPDGSRWECWDRGGKIVTEANGVIWLDLLVEKSPYPFGKRVEVEVIRHGN